MAKILFIEKKVRNEKMGMMYISAALKKKGHQTEMIQTDLEDVDELMTSYKPDFVCYSICTGEHRFALEINNILKKKYQFKSIFGGPHCTFFPEMARQENIDFLVIGQGEIAIVDIAGGREKNKIVRKPLIEDINEIPFPDRELFYKYTEFRENPMKNIITTRDCPYNCSYCFNHLWKEMYKDESHKLFQKRTVDNVIEEIKMIKKKYLLKKVLFIDDNFIVNDKWLDEFCEKYPQRINLPFLCSLTVNLLDEERVKKLKKAGLEMANFALESADPSVRKNILNRGHVKNEEVVKAIKLFKKYNIRIRMQNMIGLPVEDPLKEALNTLKFNLENKVDDSWVSIFQPYPKTKLAEYCMEKRFITGDVIEKCADSFFDETRLNIPEGDRINRLQKWWYFIVEYNLPISLVELLISLPLSKEQSQRLQEMRFEWSKKKLYGI